MTIIVIILAVIAAIAVKASTAATPSKTPAIPTNAPYPNYGPTNPNPGQSSSVQSPTFFNTGGVVGARQISGTVPPDSVLAKFHQIPTIAKPQCVIDQYNPQTGNVDFTTQYATFVQGIGTDKSVLFEVYISQDGANSAKFGAGYELDHLHVTGPGGVTDVQNYLPGMITPSTNSPSDNLVPPSLDLSNGPIVLPSPLTATAPYPASADNWTPNTPVQSGSYNPDNAIVSL